MSLRSRMRGALDTTVLVHATGLVLAAWLSWVLARTFTPVLGDGPADASARGLLVEGGHALVRGPKGSLVAPLAAVFGSLAVLEPWLALAWMHALATGARLRPALARGARLYVSAWLARIGVLVVSTVPFAIAFALPMVVHLALASARDPRIHDLFLLASFLPACALAVVVATVHDLVWSLLVHEGPRPLEAVVVGVRSLRPRHVLGRALAGALALALGVLAATCEPSGRGVAAGFALGLAGHAALLARTLVRGTWLVHCLDATTGAR